jgi:hypothetical protein
VCVCVCVCVVIFSGEGVFFVQLNVFRSGLMKKKIQSEGFVLYQNNSFIMKSKLLEEFRVERWTLF